MENNQHVVNIDISNHNGSDENEIFKIDKDNFTINPLIKKRSPYVYDERVDKLSKLLPECYVCFEKTLEYSPCICKAPLCYVCFIKILKQIDSKRCTICKEVFNINDVYNPLFTGVFTNDISSRYWCERIFSIKCCCMIFILSIYIVITSFIFGNIIVNHIFYNTYDKTISFDLFTFSFGLMGSGVSVLILYTFYEMMSLCKNRYSRSCIYCIQRCRYLCFYT